MRTARLHATGLRGWHLHLCSLGSVGLCIGLWIRAKTVDQHERGNAERRAPLRRSLAADLLAHRRLAPAA